MRSKLRQDCREISSRYRSTWMHSPLRARCLAGVLAATLATTSPGEAQTLSDPPAPSPGPALGLIPEVLPPPPADAGPASVAPAPRAEEHGFLEGTPGEAQDGYPYLGTRSGGRASIGSYFQSKIEGEIFELSREDSFPQSLILQDFRYFSGRDGVSLFDVHWDQPTELDTRFAGSYRDFRNFDLSVSRQEFHWYDRPREIPSFSNLFRVEGRLRKWKNHLFAAGFEDGTNQRRGPIVDRHEDWTRAHAKLQALWGDVRVDGSFDWTQFQERESPTLGGENRFLKFRLGRDLGVRTRLQFQGENQERLLPDDLGIQRDLSLSLSTRTYDLLEVSGLKFETQLRYQTRPSTFQASQDLEESYRGQARVSYHLGPGSVVAGIRSEFREETRLTRSGVEALLRNPRSPRLDATGEREQVFPRKNRAWFELSIPVPGHAHFTGSLEFRQLSGETGSYWGSTRQTELRDTSAEKAQASLAWFPAEGVDLQVDYRLEGKAFGTSLNQERLQDQRVEHISSFLHLSFLPRTSFQLSLSNFDIQHSDERVQADTVYEVTDYGTRIGYDVNDSVEVYGSYDRINQDGVSQIVEDLIAFGLKMGNSKSPLGIELNYTFDDFFDENDDRSSYRARIFSLHGVWNF